MYINWKGTRFKIVNEDYLITDDETQVIFHGFFYRWNGKYYVGAKTSLNNNSNLHRNVWSHYKGPIPKGWHIHHIDGNPKNNFVENLQCMSAREHLKLHAAMEGSWSRSEECKIFVKSQQIRAAEWHGSKEGIAWHKKHAFNSLPGLTGKKYDKTCKVCFKQFEGHVLWQLFCSNACKTKNRVTHQIDFIDKNCQICGSVFFSNKYSLTKTCKKECAIILSNQTRKL